MHQSILFDVDSTLATIEGLDYLAHQKGVGEIVATMTKKAMDGELSMELAMKQKMAIIKPHYGDLIDLGRAYIDHLTPGAMTTIKTLKKQGHDVWIVTGNFQPAVGILAQFLGISPNRVLSNHITFCAPIYWLWRRDMQRKSRPGGSNLHSCQKHQQHSHSH